MHRKTLFVIGSTGRQGRALITSLLTSSFTRYSFNIIALTRTPNSSAAKSLVSFVDSIPGSRLTVVRGNLDDEEGIRRIFEEYTIWGVFSIGVPSGARKEQEQQRGIMLAALSVEYGVQRYIFSSIERGGEVNDDSFAIELNQNAKVKIERYIMSINSERFKWTILRTGFFMESFEGISGKIVAGALRYRLQRATRIQLIAIDDIGHISAAIFQSPELYINTVLTVFGDAVTYDQLNATHASCKAGRQLPSIPDMVAKPLLAVNAHMRGIVSTIERIHQVQIKKRGGHDAVIRDVRAIHPGMMTFQEWLMRRERMNTTSGSCEKRRPATREKLQRETANRRSNVLSKTRVPKN